MVPILTQNWSSTLVPFCLHINRCSNSQISSALQIDQSIQTQFNKCKANSDNPKWHAIKQSNQPTTTTQIKIKNGKPISLCLFSEQTIGKTKQLQLLECITNLRNASFSSVLLSSFFLLLKIIIRSLESMWVSHMSNRDF
jgi:hypothetical protein